MKMEKNYPNVMGAASVLQYKENGGAARGIIKLPCEAWMVTW